MPDASSAGRIYFLDYVRAFIVMAVIVLHCGVPYLSFYPYRWLVVDSHTSLLCDYIVLGSEYFVMAVLFFIAGYLSPPSLAKSGPAAYARARLLRLGIPFLFGLLIMSPVMGYIRNLAKGRDPGGYLPYWLFTYFSGKAYAGYLWFLSTMLAFMLLLYAAYRLIPAVRSYLSGCGPHAASDRLLRPRGLLALGASLGLCVFAINLIVPDSYWVRLGQKGIIIFQPTRLPVYGGFFIWGIVACRAQWGFIREKSRPGSLAGWAAGSLVCLCAYLGLLQNYWPVMESSVPIRFAVCLLRAVGPLCLTMLIIGAFKSWSPAPARWKSVLAANSFGMYICHIPFVVVLQYRFLATTLPAPAKFAAIALLSLPLSFLCSHFVLRRLPVVGRYF